VTRPHPRALLSERGLRPKKRLGQNFLMDETAAHKIAQLALEGAPPDAALPIVEIGAGTGTLTRALLDESARVTAIEIDEDLVEILRSRDDLAGATILRADALTFDYGAFARGQPWLATGNLPYYIGTALLLKLIEMRDGPSTIVAMVQKDVADRLMAKPGTPAYGSLSVAVQYAMEVKRAFTLGPRAFYPAPKVDSAVVLLRRRHKPAVSPRDEGFFLQVVRAAFAYRRKTLANSLTLALGVDRTTVARALAHCELASEIRGEQLDLDGFTCLADALAEQGV
jgi:16S rRNA (adenine1518-N6/adenine1519-N6)-dimethyltransferase